MALEGFPDCSHSRMAFMISTIPMFHLLEISSEQILYIYCYLTDIFLYMLVKHSLNGSLISYF